MVDLAPGEGALAAGHGTGVVDQGQGPSLGAASAAGASRPRSRGIESPPRTAGTRPGVAGQPAGLAGGDRDPGVEPSGAEAGEQVRRGRA